MIFFVWLLCGYQDQTGRNRKAPNERLRICISASVYAGKLHVSREMARSPEKVVKRLRIWRGNPWGFESPLSHHQVSGIGSQLSVLRIDLPEYALEAQSAGTPQVGALRFKAA
jgi:hypothetical protein